MKNTANFITALRIPCAVCLLLLRPFSAWFYLFCLLCGASDLLDGFAARRLRQESAFGATLDTAADLVFAASLVIKLVAAVALPRYLTVWIVLIAGIKGGNLLCGLVKQRRFPTVHSRISKLCGGLLFAVPFYIGAYPAPFALLPLILTCALCTLAAVQESYFVLAGKEIH